MTLPADAISCSIAVRATSSSIYFHKGGAMSAITKADQATALESALESVLAQGDLSKFNAEQRVQYYQQVCLSLGLNPLTKPFEYLTFQGKLILYARRDCTEQLRKRDAVSITIVGRRLENGVYTVSARAKTADNREDESDGVVFVENLKGEALANAYMKAETKAKRRVTLSICGLGMLDESEVADVPAARPVEQAPVEVKQLPAKPVGPTEAEIENARKRLYATRTADALKSVWVALPLAIRERLVADKDKHKGQLAKVEELKAMGAEGPDFDPDDNGIDEPPDLGQRDPKRGGVSGMDAIRR